MKKIPILIVFQIAGLLGCLFVGLKLVKLIDWSWWWVSLPAWISFIVGVIVACGDK
jgi:hypothetical protein